MKNGIFDYLTVGGVLVALALGLAWWVFLVLMIAIFG